MRSQCEVDPCSVTEVLRLLAKVCGSPAGPGVGVLKDGRHAGASGSRGTGREVLASGIGRIHEWTWASIVPGMASSPEASKVSRAWWRVWVTFATRPPATYTFA